MAGDFEISVKAFDIEDGRLVMVGQMGVWDAKTYITPRELIKVVGKLLSFRMLLYFLQFPFLLFARKPNQPLSM